MINLKKPLIFFDLEATGTDVITDKIIQIGSVKYNIDGTTEEKDILINPECHIPTESTEVHGITDSMIKDLHPFCRYAKAIHSWFLGCDVSGYNIKAFDLPLLMTEFSRCGIDYNIYGVKIIDVYKIECNLAPRTLESVFHRYTGQKLDGAHNALTDVKATVAIFDKQIEENCAHPRDIEKLIDAGSNEADLMGKLVYNEDSELCFNFSKHKGTHVINNISFASWMLKSDFHPETNQVLREYLNKH